MHQPNGVTVAIRQFWPFSVPVATMLVSWAVLIPLAGCSDPSRQTAAIDSKPEGTRYPHVDPETLLKSTFRRYRAAESYSDSARVRLAYDISGRRENQWAPLNVRLDQRNFYVEAYSLRCYCDSRQTLSWIKDESTDDFGRQVSVRQAPAQRGDWEQLTLDPIFQQQLSAGLGGPPPQLDWLFAAEPMQRLFDNQHMFEYGSQQSIDNRMCQSVIVRADSKRYVFWIDREASIIREVELPSVIAAPAPNLPPQEMTLTVQLSSATFQPSSQPPPIDPLSTRPHYVESFVPLPPIEPAKVLGNQLDQGMLRQLQSKPVAETVSVVVSFPDSNVSLAVSQLLAHWHERLPSEMSSRVRVYHVGLDAPANPSLGSSVTHINDDPRSWCVPFGMPNGCVSIVAASGELAWTQGTVLPNELPNLGVIVTDILKGVDVPERLKTDWRFAQAAYQEELQRRYRAPLQ
jgi:hypothetical protein